MRLPGFAKFHCDGILKQKSMYFNFLPRNYAN